MSKDQSVALQTAPPTTSAFLSIQSFEDAQRMAMSLSKSTIVPKDFQNNPANCIIALEYAQRIGESPFVIMQNLNVIQGRPGLKAEYLIARINSSGRFREPLQFVYEHQGDAEKMTCYAYTVRMNGERVQGTKISMKMAKEEGWLTRTGTKWRTMPEQMIAYRAAAFFQRLHCPDISFGMQTTDEIIDIGYTEVKDTSQADSLTERIKNQQQEPTPTPTPTEQKAKPKNEEVI